MLALIRCGQALPLIAVTAIMCSQIAHVKHYLLLPQLPPVHTVANIIMQDNC